MANRSSNRGLVYLRRSTDQQENSLQMQLGWAIESARRLGVEIDASVSDIAHMQSRNLNAYKSIRLDDAISGTKMDRPGLNALRQDVDNDKLVSHVFVQKRDRLGRPEDLFEMGAIERSISSLGVTIVFDDKTVSPNDSGISNLGEDISMLVEYHSGRSWLVRHTERVVESKVLLAKQGAWTGGNAPYGYKRVLVGSDGTILEDLEDGRKVSQAGCHVEIAPGDENELTVVRRILDQKLLGVSDKKIAKVLNQEGIPSPGAGRSRIDQGHKHMVSGKWSSSAIKAVCTNKATIGYLQTGRRSDGTIRRMTKTGHRKLDDNDKDINGNLRQITHEEADTILVKTRHAAQYDPDKWEKVQELRQARGASQRGISRGSDAAKYPLACRVFDQSCGCGSVMYGRSAGEKTMYTCGRYMRSSGAECENNHVDAHALLNQSLHAIRQIVLDRFGRDRLRLRIEARAEMSRVDSGTSTRERELQQLIEQRKKVQRNLETVKDRMTTEEDDDVYSALKARFTELKAELQRVDDAIAQSKKVIDQAVSHSDDIDLAMKLCDSLSLHTNNREFRGSICEFVKKSGLHVGLAFTGAVKGTKKPIRKLTAGIITFSDRDLAVPIHGKDRVASN